jgi:hypothetical protein
MAPKVASRVAEPIAESPVIPWVVRIAQRVRQGACQFLRSTS